MSRNVLAWGLVLLLSSHSLAGAVVLIAGTGSWSSSGVVLVAGTTPGSGGGGGGGSGDVTTNTSVSIDSELPLFSGITGKILKRATFTGLLYVTSGVTRAAIPGSDYQAALGFTAQPLLEHAPVAHEFVTGFTAGSALTARPTLANLSDGTQVVTLNTPQIVEDKQIVPRVCEFPASSGTLAPNLNLCDKVYRHDVSGPIAMDPPTASGGNPRPMQALTLSFKATAEQPITWPAIYGDGYGVPLPTTIPSARYLALLFLWNVTSAKYELWAGDPELGTTGATGVASHLYLHAVMGGS